MVRGTGTHSLARSLTHSHSLSLTPSISLIHSHSLTHSLTHSLPHSLTPSLTHSPTHSGAVRLPLAWQAQYTQSLLVGCGARGRHWAAAASRVSGAVHRASWSSCGARGLGRGCLSCGRRSTWSSRGARGRRWAAAAFPLAAAGRGCLSCGRRSTQSLASWSSCGARGRCWVAAAFRVAGAVHRASWSSCACGRHWAAAASCAAGSTQSLLVELRRAWAPLGRGCLLCGRQYTEPPGRAAHLTYHITIHHSSTSHTSFLTH